ncbi:hypothetical protein [Ramlibacter rhizophilus]|uniref:Uncharacterized protein n=1 Tax=Ramlibacter rhizophilus TaxID=1781167 RepID=A0A4Z0BI01_9BURK|nr:hypothetical protein [Ramlibacter rhizophilus]TFY97518.1 hypothetical protein EZ242_18550 [Ramlibacter rhizophilus]
MATPMELMMRQVDWRETGQQPSAENLPYATHSGVLEIMGHRLRCYRLNTGQAVFDADDVHRFFDNGQQMPQ